MSDWVRFHRELCQGEKRGLSRATRFIYMEISREARGRHGVIVLPIGMSDQDAVADILGGNQKEIKEAIRALTATPDPMLAFEDAPNGRRQIVVTNWAKWNPGDVTASERQQRARDKKRDGKRDHERNVTRDAGVTDRDSDRDVTEPVRASAPARPNLLSLSSESPPSEPDLEDLTARSTGEPPSVVRMVSAPASAVIPQAGTLVTLTDPLPEGLRAAAEIIGVQDIDRAWLTFTGSRNGSVLSNGVNGEWQAYCARFAGIEKRERARGPGPARVSQAEEDSRSSPSRRRIEPLPDPKRGSHG